MKIINDGNALVIKSWCDAPEDGAIKQAKNLAGLPFAFRQICLMPDTHQGYGMPIGGVMATINNVVPNAVGVDIGCGMAAVKTSLRRIDRDVLLKILEKIREKIPVGFNKHNEPKHKDFMPKFTSTCYEIVEREYQNACLSLGTLGGGNHFIEIQHGDDGHIWVMLHSGSRNLGKQVADFYNKEAVSLNQQYFSVVPKEWELAFLPRDSDTAQSYMTEMQYCVDFADRNREIMMSEILDIFSEFCNATFDPMINIAHNYARMENHFGKNVLVHRKGATSAKDGETGIIPGSQGTASYIVRGKGSKDSFTSCSHGAGRAMGRKQAEQSLDLSIEQKKLDDLGIIHAVRSIKDLDEASGAYKDIDVVMKEQSDLVDIITELKPLAVIKG